jgi:hypothetical protein
MSNNLATKFINELFRNLSQSEPIALARLLKVKNQQFKSVYFRGFKLFY